MLAHIGINARITHGCVIILLRTEIDMEKADLILLSAGSGERYGGTLPKQFVKIAGKTILQHTIDALQLPLVSRIIVTLPTDRMDEKLDSGIEIAVVDGGETRQESVQKALSKVQSTHVIIHEAVRPGIKGRVIEDVLKAATVGGCATTSMASIETPYAVEGDFVGKVIDRKSIRLMQLPQAFETDLLKKAHEAASETDATDDCQLCMALGKRPVWVEGDYSSMKLTYADQYPLFEAMITNNRSVTVQRAIRELQIGNPVIIYSADEDEGDVCYPAELANVDIVNFMVRECGGIICVPITEDRSNELGLSLIGEGSPAFVTTLDTTSVGTGTSAFDRALTIKALGDGTPKEKFTTPGHINPLSARRGLLADRKGHTETSVYLVKAAGYNPASVICEVMNVDGHMSKMPDLTEFAKKWNYTIVSVEEIYDYFVSTNS